MKYSAKVKRCEEVYNAISSLPKDGEIKVLYGKDYNAVLMYIRLELMKAIKER